MNDAITAEQLEQLLVAMQQMSDHFDALIAIPDIRRTLDSIMGPADAEGVVEALASKVVTYTTPPSTIPAPFPISTGGL